MQALNIVGNFENYDISKTNVQNYSKNLFQHETGHSFNDFFRVWGVSL